MVTRRQRKLDAVVERLQVQYGPAVIRKAAAAEQVARAATGLPALDRLLGGGVPRGRITELLGAATCGKATLAARIIGQAQAAAPADEPALAAWLDLPRTCDPEHLRGCGVALEHLLVVRPAAADDGLAVARHLIESNTLSVLVVDASAGLAEADAGLVAGSLEHLAALVVRTPTALLFLTEPAAAGQALAPGSGSVCRSTAALRLELRRGGWLRCGSGVCGYEGQIRVLKNRLGLAEGSAAWRVEFPAGGQDVGTASQ